MTITFVEQRAGARRRETNGNMNKSLLALFHDKGQNYLLYHTLNSTYKHLLLYYVTTTYPIYCLYSFDIDKDGHTISLDRPFFLFDTVITNIMG